MLLDDLAPVALVAVEQLFEDEATRGVEVALDAHAVAVVAELELLDDLLAPLDGDEPQRLVVHRAGEDVVAAGQARVGEVHPLVGEELALRCARVGLDALLEESRDGALRGADRSVQEDDALLGPVVLGGGAEHVHQPHQWDVEPEDGVFAFADRVFEEGVSNQPLLVVDVLLFAVAHDHVVEPLEGVPGHLGAFANHLQVFLEATLPVEVPIAIVVLERSDARDHLRHAGRVSRHFRSAANHVVLINPGRVVRCGGGG